MAKKSDISARLSASRVCSLTGVRPQTRETWVKRDLLRSAETYGEIDVIEQAVVKALLEALPKSHVDVVWHEVRPRLRESVGDQATLAVWDPEKRRVSVMASESELRAAICHGRPVHVLPLGELVKEARRAYRIEVQAAKRVAAARAKAGSSPRASTTTAAPPGAPSAS